MLSMLGGVAFSVMAVGNVLAVVAVRCARAESESQKRTRERLPICNEARTWNTWLLG